ncbi:alpha/beta hydrolase fold domain-containing protein [Paeniglutamicibacter kerguelensis]|uniref:Acetyl esterase/lipase n=1 Tax=Paeniglutamicibacter kerguelensis TaxID=254788 RepID=A0ABS4X8E7_9MICC|nr:alpha/beta hydrolase fold domain-containing protein [Paeniglutamicibacter kerguelensis]MBP2384518.1 acetyl esterase/lipase [Paeniglutamicibacter kerguelensis]
MSAMDRFDPEILTLFTAATATQAPEAKLPERGDALGLREVIDSGLANIPRPSAPGIESSSHLVGTSDGSLIELRWYSATEDKRTDRPAVVYFHGGGRIGGKIDHYDGVVRHYVQETNVPMLLVDYRLAPEHTGTTAPEDGICAVEWLIEHADELRIDTDRIAVMGDSGGGGVAAGTAILARDRGIAIARQILIYPMLDDRNTKADPTLEGLVAWNHDTNWTGWNAVLGDAIGSGGVSPVTAPGRLNDFSGIPRAYIEVGDLDIFRDESIAYARGLYDAGIPCDLNVNAGVMHGHDLMSFDMELTRRTLAGRFRAIEAL